MKEKEEDVASYTKASASGNAQEEDISPTILEAAQILSQVVSQSVSTYKRRARSANKGKEIDTGLDFFSAAKERLNFAKVEVNTEVNPGSAGVNTGNTPVSTPSVVQTVILTILSLDEEVARRVHLDALLAKRIQEEKELSEQQQKRKAEVQEAT
ncbi:hypothetical protein Tco_1097206, partial [Tanacetum coccineum]